MYSKQNSQLNAKDISQLQSIWNLIRNKNYETALADIEQMQYMNDETHTAAGKCYFELHKYPKAIEHFLLINLPTNYSQIFLARCYQEQGKFGEAIKIYNSIPDWENNKWVLLNVARIAFNMKRYDASIIFFKQVKGWETNKEVLFGLGQCYKMMTRYSEAVNFYFSIPGGEKNPLVLQDLAGCFREMGQFARADLYFRAAMVMGPNYKTPIHLYRHFKHIQKQSIENTEIILRALFQITLDGKPATNFQKAIQNLNTLPIDLSIVYFLVRPHFAQLPTKEQLCFVNIIKLYKLERLFGIEVHQPVSNALSQLKIQLGIKVSHENWHRPTFFKKFDPRDTTIDSHVTIEKAKFLYSNEGLAEEHKHKLVEEYKKKHSKCLSYIEALDLSTPSLG